MTVEGRIGLGVGVGRPFGCVDAIVVRLLLISAVKRFSLRGRSLVVEHFAVDVQLRGCLYLVAFLQGPEVGFEHLTQALGVGVGFGRAATAPSRNLLSLQSSLSYRCGRSCSDDAHVSRPEPGAHGPILQYQISAKEEARL